MQLRSDCIAFGAGWLHQPHRLLLYLAYVKPPQRHWRRNSVKAVLFSMGEVFGRPKSVRAPF